VVPSGDKAVGISALVDTSCTSGGLGCFNPQCRFCKMWNSTQSQNFVQCPSSMTLTPTTSTPPIVVDMCWSAVSPGDLATGIIGESNAECVNGGLGCFSRTCRFCKAFETPKSSAYASCRTAQTSADGSSSSISTPTPTATPTPTPTSTSARTQDDFCRSLVTSGDTEMGISALGDANCQGGGLGCLSTSCRFCKTRSTAQSSHLSNCTELMSTRSLEGFESAAKALVSASEPCLALVSGASAAQGVYGFTDKSCSTESKPGQCFTSSCRACKISSSSSTTNLPACPKYIKKVVEMEDEESAEAVLTSWDCTFALTIDTLAGGIAGYVDKTCPTLKDADKDTGCFARLGCRLCAFVATDDFPLCPDGQHEAAVSTVADTPISSTATVPHTSTIIDSNMHLAVSTSTLSAEETETASTGTQQDFTSVNATYRVSIGTTLAIAAAVVVALVAVRSLQRRRARVAAARARIGAGPSIMIIGGGDPF